MIRLKLIVSKSRFISNKSSSPFSSLTMVRANGCPNLLCPPWESLRGFLQQWNTVIRRKFIYLILLVKDIQHALNLPALFTTETVKDAVTSIRRPFITFVLGGPGSGKGTQCARIASAFGVAHLSAGDLLREEISSKSTNGELIRSIIKEGKIVPSEITVNLIHKAIKSSTADKFLIDGFPRSEENRIAFERIIGVEPDLVLFFDCPEEEMVKRVLGRNQGRIDDNIETIKKRLKVFEKLNLPVISYYSAKGKVHKISAKGSVDEIFEKVHQLFSSLKEANGFA